MELPISRSLILSGARLTWEWDEQLVQEVLKNQVIDNSLIIVTSQDLSVVNKDGPWLTEPWFGTKYMLEKVDEELVTSVSEVLVISTKALLKSDNAFQGKCDLRHTRSYPSQAERIHSD